MVYIVGMPKKDKFYADAGKSKERFSLFKNFNENLPSLPGELIEEIFAIFYEDYEQARLSRSVLEEKLGAVICLFALDYSDEDGPLTQEEWKSVTEAVNDFALDLDDKLLMYIMSKAVEKGCFKD